MDKLIKDTNLAVVIGTHSWKEQFTEAVTVSAGQWLLYPVILNACFVCSVFLDFSKNSHDVKVKLCSCIDITLKLYCNASVDY